MKINSVIASLSVIAAFAFADDSSSTINTATITTVPEATSTEHTRGRTRHTTYLGTVESSKVAAYESDLSSLRSSIHGNSLYTSLTAALATFTATETTTGRRHRTSDEAAWVSSLPSDLQSFVSANREAKSSIFSKDIGSVTQRPRHGGTKGMTTATGTATGDGALIAGTETAATKATTTGQAQNSQTSGQKVSEAPNPYKLAGATVFAILGAFAMAALLL